MTLTWEEVIIDSNDHRALARWWARALDWELVDEDDDACEIRSPRRGDVTLTFVPVPETKTIKNRLHLDFVPDDQDAEVKALLALGAHRVDIGQGERSWVVLADPEGNEFCVLAARPSVGRASPLGGEAWEDDEYDAEAEADQAIWEPPLTS